MPPLSHRRSTVRDGSEADIREGRQLAQSRPRVTNPDDIQVAGASSEKIDVITSVHS